MNNQIYSFIEKQIEALEELSENEASLTVINHKARKIKMDIYEICEQVEDLVEDSEDAEEINDALTDVLDCLEDLTDEIDEEEISDLQSFVGYPQVLWGASVGAVRGVY